MYLKQEASGSIATNTGPSTETEPVVAAAPVVTEPTSATSAGMETNSSRVRSVGLEHGGVIGQYYQPAAAPRRLA